MNTKTFFSKFPTFARLWAKYQKKIAPLPLGWTVMSDYCLDNRQKHDCITFTISPVLGQIEPVANFFNRKLPRDIKQIRRFSQEECEFLHWAPLFKEDIHQLQKSSLIPKEFCQRLRKFELTLKSKCQPIKTLQNLSLVSFIFGKIVEFLCVKHYTEEIHWFPDRDNIMQIGNGIIKEISNIQCTNSIAGRVKYPKIRIGGENPKTHQFLFEPYTRYPDIITGIFSSIDFEAQLADKEKHIQGLKEIVIDNPHIVVFSFTPDKISCMNLRTK